MRYPKATKDGYKKIAFLILNAFFIIGMFIIISVQSAVFQAVNILTFCVQSHHNISNLSDLALVPFLVTLCYQKLVNYALQLCKISLCDEGIIVYKYFYNEEKTDEFVNEDSIPFLLYKSTSIDKLLVNDVGI